jgi:hypothetical protein
MSTRGVCVSVTVMSGTWIDVMACNVKWALDSWLYCGQRWRKEGNELGDSEGMVGWRRRRRRRMKEHSNRARHQI